MATQAEKESFYLLPAKSPGGGSIFNPGAAGSVNIYVPSTKPAASKTISEASRRARGGR
jgi:hypothetical protein